MAKEKINNDPDILIMCAWERESVKTNEVFCDFRHAELGEEDFTLLILGSFHLSHKIFIKALFLEHG